MKQSAKVVEENGHLAKVEVSRKTICEGCHKSDGSSACSACLTFGDKKASALALNKIGAKVGDRVVVEASSQRIIVYSGIIFFLPILIAFTVYIFTAKSEYSLLYVLLSFIFSFALAAFVLEKIVRKKPDLTIVEFEKNEQISND